MNLRAAARQAAIKYKLDPDLFARQIGAESGFNPRAVSPAGARGVAQIMPATARGWGVNPDDPVASLDAAAKNMSRYVHTYGNWRDALVAYNAGPGAVGKPLYRETQAYVQKILGGSNPQPAAQSDARFDTGAPRSAQSDSAALLKQYLATRNQPGALLSLAAGLKQEAPQAARSATQSGAQGSTQGRSKLLEMFWQGDGGVNVKNGQLVPQGFVSGHTDHVHVAAGPKTVVQLAKLAQSMGLHVGENPNYGGVHPVHVKNSLHYKGEAIDVSGDPAKMRAYAHRVARSYGLL